MAIKNKLLPNDMPSKLLILSDMQFDQACTYGDKFLTGFEHLENKFILNGYNMPAIIFWNLRGDTRGYVNKSNQKGTTTLSGFSPSLFKSFMSGNFNIENTPTFPYHPDTKESWVPSCSIGWQTIRVYRRRQYQEIDRVRWSSAWYQSKDSAPITSPT